jgi:hypothetical protein
MGAVSMMKRHPVLWPVIVALGCATGCATSLGPGGGEPTGGELEVVPSLAVSAYAAQSVVPKKTAAGVKHVVVKLFKLAGSTETQAAQDMDIAKADLGRTIRFRYLNFNTKYRVRGYAYQADGTAAADLVSRDAYVDVEVGSDDRPALARLPIPLMDVLFDAAGTGSIEIKTAGVTDAGTLSVVVP